MGWQEGNFEQINEEEKNLDEESKSHGTFKRYARREEQRHFLYGCRFPRPATYVSRHGGSMVCIQ